MRICDRCETPQGNGELIDEQFLCNGCLAVLLVDAQMDDERKIEEMEYERRNQPDAGNQVD